MEPRDSAHTNPHIILKEYFGYDSFRTGQEAIIQAILEKKDALAVMPTGAGKSICYQVPAMLLSGITVVISPLISLMQDQVKALNAAGIHAAYINSTLSESQIGKALELAAKGQYRIIYVAPERLESWMFQEFAQAADISMVTVDEAHCISQWGQDFRPSYLKIVDFIESLPHRPIVTAFTATATKEVTDDICCILKLRDPLIQVLDFDRPNLYFEVVATGKKDLYVQDYLSKHPKESGIIYCATRKNVDKLFELLFKTGISVTRYHAGMGNLERKRNQDDFVYDRVQVMVATNAFGMGIDKSNVRYVLHYNMPQSMENYYQEAGRAGRDGEDARCILLYSPQDVMINKMLLEQKDFSAIDPSDIYDIMQRDQQRLRTMENYSTTTDCLRNYILRYFGEHPLEACENCGNCNQEFTDTDATAEARQIINCVFETKGRYGIAIIAGILTGANRARIREIGGQNYRTYGVLSDKGEGFLKDIIQQMISQNMLILTTDRYSVLKLGPHAMKLKEESNRVIIRQHIQKTEDPLKKLRKKSTDDLTSLGYQLFEELRSLRMEIAREAGLPPYIVFNDKTLIDMCLRLPVDKPGMLQVSGVAAAKYEKYGESFLNRIHEFISAHPDQVISTWKPPVTQTDTYSDGNESETEGGSKNAKSKMQKTKKSGSSKVKAEFSLAPHEAESFAYKETMPIGEIREEMNRIATSTDMKKMTFPLLNTFLLEEGLVTEIETEIGKHKVSTEKGTAAGIISLDKISANGLPYVTLLYPESIQRQILAHWTK